MGAPLEGLSDCAAGRDGGWGFPGGGERQQRHPAAFGGLFRERVDGGGEVDVEGVEALFQ